MILDLISNNIEVERYTIGRSVVSVSREDLAFQPPLPPNAKMAALYEIVKEKSKKYKIMGILAKHQIGTSYSTGLPYIAKEHKVKPIIFYPSNGTIPALAKRLQKRDGGGNSFTPS